MINFPFGLFFQNFPDWGACAHLSLQVGKLDGMMATYL
jgi:hypothetical protein